MIRYEWAGAGDGPYLVPPDEVRENADDGNPEDFWGLAWVTGSNGCMVTGTLDDLDAMADKIKQQTRGARREQ